LANVAAPLATSEPFGFGDLLMLDYLLTRLYAMKRGVVS
jgi:hypothetical protein